MIGDWDDVEAIGQHVTLLVLLLRRLRSTVTRGHMKIIKNRKVKKAAQPNVGDKT